MLLVQLLSMYLGLLYCIPRLRCYMAGAVIEHVSRVASVYG